MKECSNCHEEKDYSQYYFCNTNQRYIAKCKICYGEKQSYMRKQGLWKRNRKRNEKRYRNREKEREYEKRKRDENQSYIRKIKSKPCMDCGVSYPYYVMEFDHVRGKKVERISRMTTRSIKKIKEEIKKCELATGQP